MKAIILLLSFSIMSMQAQKQQKEGLQEKIEKAFLYCIENESEDALEKIAETLTLTFDENDTVSTRYWLSYTRYHQALLAAEINQKKKQAESYIDAAISLLKPSLKDSESLALLSIQTGYSIRFKSYFAMMGLGQDSHNYAETALSLDSNNLRAYYALAINNFYTPKVFGGGTQVEVNLKQALAMSENSMEENQPTWGKDSVYVLLVNHYIKEEKDSLAKKYLAEGLALFPKNKQLKNLTKL